MSDQPQNDSLDDVTVEPLSDEALEDVAGGIVNIPADSSSGTCCSCSSCSSSAV